MPNVQTIRESDWAKDDGTHVMVTTVRFDDGSEAPGYDLPPGLEIGKALPQGWEIATSKNGKPYIKVPKSGKGQQPTAYRNTKDGQAYEQERMDRRTALMQAVALAADDDPTDTVVTTADRLYTWLRQTSGAGVAGEVTPAPVTQSVPVTDKAGGVQPVAFGEGGPGSPPTGDKKDCPHEHRSPLKPDGSAMPAGRERCIDCGLRLEARVDAERSS